MLMSGWDLSKHFVYRMQHRGKGNFLYKKAFPEKHKRLVFFVVVDLELFWVHSAPIQPFWKEKNSDYYGENDHNRLLLHSRQ